MKIGGFQFLNMLLNKFIAPTQVIFSRNLSRILGIFNTFVQWPLIQKKPYKRTIDFKKCILRCGEKPLPMANDQPILQFQKTHLIRETDVSYNSRDLARFFSESHKQILNVGIYSWFKYNNSTKVVYMYTTDIFRFFFVKRPP